MFFFYQNQNHTHPSRYNLLVHGFKDLVVWLARLARQSLENSWIEAQQQPLTKAQKPPLTSGPRWLVRIRV